MNVYNLDVFINYSSKAKCIRFLALDINKYLCQHYTTGDVKIIEWFGCCKRDSVNVQV